MTPSSTSWHRDPERRLGRALADAGLQHPQLAALDGELDVAQVAVVRSSRCMMRSAASYEALSICSRSASGIVLRMPATTSSPWAFMR
jgi:hypothetical protein